MKKYAKLLGLGIAAIGVVGSVSIGYALYVNAPAENSNHISVGSHTDTTADINYRVDAPVVKYAQNNGTIVSEASAINPDTNKAIVQIPLGADPKTASTLQPYVVGKATVTLSGSAVTGESPIATASIAVKGFTAGKWGESNANAVNGGFINNVAELDKLVVKVDGTQYLEVTLTFDVLSEANMVAAAKSKVRIDVNWGVESGYDYAYLIGDETGWEMPTGYKYRMVPNIESDDFQWWYSALEPTRDGGFKARKDDNVGTTWSANNATDSGNYEVTTGNSYDFYWNGGSSDQLTRYVPAS